MNKKEGDPFYSLVAPEAMYAEYPPYTHTRTHTHNSVFSSVCEILVVCWVPTVGWSLVGILLMF